MEEQVRAILDAPGAKKFGFNAEILGKMGEKAVADLYGKIASGPKPAPASATVPAAQPAPANDEWYQRFRELQNRHDSGGKLKEEEIAELKNLSAKLSEVAEAFAVRGPEPRPTPGPSMPDGAFGLNSTPRPTPSGAFGMKATEGEPFDWDQYKKPWYEPATPEQPKLPRAEPVDPSRKATDAFGLKAPAPPAPRPRAEVVSDAEKSREQWTPAGAMNDLKGYLPGGIGQKLGGKFEAIGGAYKAASAEAGEAGAGMAGRVAAGVGEAAIAAGPAAALVAVELAATLAAKGMNTATKAIEGAGQAAAMLAGNDHLGLFNAAVGGAAEVLGEIPIAGKVWAAELRLATAPVMAFTVAAKAFVDRGREIAAYSGHLSSANALTNVRSQLADINEAQRTGRAIARLTDANSRNETAIRDTMVPIKNLIANGLATLAEKITPTLERIARNSEVAVAVGAKAGSVAVQGIEAGFKSQFPVLGAIVTTLETMLRLQKKKEVVDSINPVLEEYRRITENLKKNRNPPGANPAAAAGEQRLNLPIFGGR